MVKTYYKINIPNTEDTLIVQPFHKEREFLSIEETENYILKEKIKRIKKYGNFS